jgi:hypothetical protein
MRKGTRTFASRKRLIAGLCAFLLAGVLAVEATEAEIAVYKAGGTPVWTPCTASGAGPVKFTCTFATALTRAEVEADTEQETIVTS